MGQNVALLALALGLNGPERDLEGELSYANLAGTLYFRGYLTEESYLHSKLNLKGSTRRELRSIALPFLFNAN